MTGFTYHCPYCNWVGVEPNIADYPYDDEFLEADRKFQDDARNHECSKYGGSNE